jgi:CheY-like chemotaxis protein
MLYRKKEHSGARTAMSTTVQKTIMVIDDDAVFCELITEVLGDHGHNVLTRGEGEGALEAIREQPPDLVILDVFLPGVSGYHVLAGLLDEPALRRIPVLVCTGEPLSIQYRGHALASLGVTVLEKPFDIATLVGHVNRLLKLVAADG